MGVRCSEVRHLASGEAGENRLDDFENSDARDDAPPAGGAGRRAGYPRYFFAIRWSREMQPGPRTTM